MPPLSFQGLRPKTLVSSPAPLFLQPLLPHFASISLQKPSGSDHFPLLPQPHPGVSHQVLAWIIAASSKLSPAISPYPMEVRSRLSYAQHPAVAPTLIRVKDKALAVAYMPCSVDPCLASLTTPLQPHWPAPCSWNTPSTLQP